MPAPTDLTIEEAAEMLNVSSDFVVGLLETGMVPFLVADGDRRMKEADLLAYKQADDRGREAVLDELAVDAQKHGLGY